MERRLSIFISYARSDGLTMAERLSADLDQHNYKVWRDLGNIDASMNWSEEIEQAINSCDVFLALASHDACSSKIFRAEVSRAERIGKLIIPVLVQPGADVPIHIEGMQYLDFSSHSHYAHRLAELLEDIETAYNTGAVTARPSVRAAFLNEVRGLPPGDRLFDDEFSQSLAVELTRMLTDQQFLALSDLRYYMMKKQPAYSTAFKKNDARDALPDYGLMVSEILSKLVELDLLKKTQHEHGKTWFDYDNERFLKYTELQWRFDVGRLAQIDYPES